MSERHPATTGLLRFFQTAHLAGTLGEAASGCAALAHLMTHKLPDGPELTAGLRKLLEAKDCFMRAALDVNRDG